MKIRTKQHFMKVFIEIFRRLTCYNHIYVHTSGLMGVNYKIVIQFIS